MSRKIFEGYFFAWDISSFTHIPFKKKHKLREDVTLNGGIISYILTRKSDFLLTADAKRTYQSYKGVTAEKYGTKILKMEFIEDCIRSQEFIDFHRYTYPMCESDYRNDNNELKTGKIRTLPKGSFVNKPQKETNLVKIDDLTLANLPAWPYKDPSAPSYPENDYEIAKDMLFKKVDHDKNITEFLEIELHVVPQSIPCESQRYRIFTHHGNLESLKQNDHGRGQVVKEVYYSYTAEEAMGLYVALHDNALMKNEYLRATSLLSTKIGSDKMKEQNIDIQSTNDDEIPLILEVASLVKCLWNEADKLVENVVDGPVQNIKLQKLQEAESKLALMKECLDDSDSQNKMQTLWEDFCQCIPQLNGMENVLKFNKSLIADKQNLCQIIRDILTVSECYNMSSGNSDLALYRALKCHIHYLENDDEEFKRIKTHVLSSQRCSSDINIINIFSLHRPVEERKFTHNMDDKRLLFHASRANNFVGILSRGLLLPKIVVDDFGGERTDAGMLGEGIYFSDSISTSTKYAARGNLGSRFMLICEVALGKVKRYRHFNKDLTSPPDGYNSVCGVAESDQEPSDFKANEFVIYNTNQQQMRYLVEFGLNGENTRKRHIDFTLLKELDLEEDEEPEQQDFYDQSIDISDVTSIADPLSKVKAGLKGSSDDIIPLEAVHVKAKLLDLVSQVVVLQSYKNNSSVPIEAKYVFPLDDMAAVCGFEAFINGKHIIGEVKEKEQAHKEYREAISKGHGAYLMDEETPDMFTVSVGNLPPNASVLIKITYVAELNVEGESICFKVPGSVAPWKQSQALEYEIQSEVDTIKIQQEKNTSIQVAVEMPFEIKSIYSPTHPILIKRTATKAVIEMLAGHVIGDGFQLDIKLAEIHVPRMWIESHDTIHDSEAGMLVFYPEFESETSSHAEVLYFLDASNSMQGSCLKEAKKLLVMCLTFMPDNWLFNVIVFGTSHSEVFPTSQPKNNYTITQATDYIMSIAARKGSTDLWKALESLSLIQSMSAVEHARNVIIISDGHVTEEATTLELVRKHRMKTRVFTMGIGPTCNRHFLRSVARIGGGDCEFFDSKLKSKWEKKVKNQTYKCGQPGLTSISVTWQQHDSYGTPPEQAPSEIVSLFNGSRLVVYGLLSNCTQASLTAEVNGMEISTMVSTSDLSITRGKILHQLVARAMIRDWEEGNLDANNTWHEVAKHNKKDSIITLSKEFSIVSQFTSFVAIETREKDETFNDCGPQLLELVDAENVDIIPYVSWEESTKKTTADQPNMRPEDNVHQLLKGAATLEGISLLQAEDLYKEACSVVIENFKELPLQTSCEAFFDLATFYSRVSGDEQKQIVPLYSLVFLLAKNDVDINELSELDQEKFHIDCCLDDLQSDFSRKEDLANKVQLVQSMFPSSRYKWQKDFFENLAVYLSDTDGSKYSSELDSESEDDEEEQKSTSSVTDTEDSEDEGEEEHEGEEESKYPGSKLLGTLAARKLYRGEHKLTKESSEFDSVMQLRRSRFSDNEEEEDSYDDITVEEEVLYDDADELTAYLDSPDLETGLEIDMEKDLRSCLYTETSQLDEKRGKRGVREQAMLYKMDSFDRAKLESDFETSDRLLQFTAEVVGLRNSTSEISDDSSLNREMVTGLTSTCSSSRFSIGTEKTSFGGARSGRKNFSQAGSGEASFGGASSVATSFGGGGSGAVGFGGAGSGAASFDGAVSGAVRFGGAGSGSASFDGASFGGLFFSANRNKQKRPGSTIPGREPLFGSLRHEKGFDFDSNGAKPLNMPADTPARSFSAQSVPETDKSGESIPYCSVSRRGAPSELPRESIAMARNLLKAHDACEDMSDRYRSSPEYRPTSPGITQPDKQTALSSPLPPFLPMVRGTPLPPPRTGSIPPPPPPPPPSGKEVDDIFRCKRLGKPRSDPIKDNSVLGVRKEAVQISSRKSRICRSNRSQRTCVSPSPPPLLPLSSAPCSMEKDAYLPHIADLSSSVRKMTDVINMKGEYTRDREAERPRSAILTAVSKKKKMAISKVEVKMKHQQLVEQLFHQQDPDGYWMMDKAVFASFGLDCDRCETIVKELGALSLGIEVYHTILKLVATMLMLALLRSHFPDLFPQSLGPFTALLTRSFLADEKWGQQIKKALHWVKTVDKKVPSVCSRLELGPNWEKASDWLIQRCRNGDVRTEAYL